MGFLSAYSGTTRVEISHPDKEYWVDIKDCLTQGDKAEAENALTTSNFQPGEDVEMSVDVALYRHMMLLASIVAWNLDDDNGSVWPVDLEHVQGLPGPVFDKIWKIVDEKNKPEDKKVRQRFPDGDVRRNSTGNRRTAKPR